MKEISILTTADLWQKYAGCAWPSETFYGKPDEDFLITPLETVSSMIKLPTQPHRRKVHELVLVTQGCVVRSTDMQLISIQAGEIHLSMADKVSTVEAFSSDLCGFYCHFSTEVLTNLYCKIPLLYEITQIGDHMRNRAVTLPSKSFQVIVTLLTRLWEAFQHRQTWSLIDAYLVALCFEIKAALPSKPPTLSSKAIEITHAFKELIIQSEEKHQAISAYACRLNISPNHLNKSVKFVTGKTASVLLAELIVLEAKVLLKHTESSVSEIAYHLGFQDHSYFSRFFKQHTGLVPSAFKSLAKSLSGIE